MEVKLAVSIWTLLFLTAESQSNAIMTPPSASPNTTSPNTTCGPCPQTDPSTAPCTTTTPPQPVIGVLTVDWDKSSSCEGEVRLYRLSPNGSVDVYDDHNMTAAAQKQAAEKILSGVCEGRTGCSQDAPSLDADGPKNVRVRCGLLKNLTRASLPVSPPVESKEDCGGYKAVTGLLLTLVIVILVVRFGKPTLKTLQKRMSDRRNSRWIGPTQSQSVSYHRGKTAVQSDTDNRRYPALERLTVNNSREPSSNRNSDFDF